MERGSDFFIANGVDGNSGRYALPPIDFETLSSFVSGLSLDQDEISEISARLKNKRQRYYKLAAGNNPRYLNEAGWGVIFRPDCDPAIIEALRPLLDWRKEAANQNGSNLYQEYSGKLGYCPGDKKNDWLGRPPRDAGPGSVNPLKVPYYLLIVGGPEDIPFDFQIQLDGQHAVGRIFFESVDDYACYAQSVVRAERENLRLSREAYFFGTQNQDDPSTKSSLTDLVSPLANSFVEKHVRLQQTWTVQRVFGEQATKARLSQILCGANTPAFLFSATHGAAFEKGDPVQQQQFQGSLVCQDWPGPKKWGKQTLRSDFYFSADDLGDQASLWGTIAFFFACYSVGTPMRDEFVEMSANGPRTIAERSFIARLPQRMLAHPNGGALAVIGHIDRAWSFSYQWTDASPQLQVFEDVFYNLLAGYPIGYAFEAFNDRYGELAKELDNILQDMKYGYQPKGQELPRLWTALNDAKNFVVFGDPAVRLMI